MNIYIKCFFNNKRFGVTRPTKQNLNNWRSKRIQKNFSTVPCHRSCCRKKISCCRNQVSRQNILVALSFNKLNFVFIQIVLSCWIQLLPPYAYVKTNMPYLKMIQWNQPGSWGEFQALPMVSMSSPWLVLLSWMVLMFNYSINFCLLWLEGCGCVYLLSLLYLAWLCYKISSQVWKW